MEEKDLNGLENLIKNVKSQPPLIPIEAIDGMVKDFYTNSATRFKNWMKPAGIAVVAAFIILATYFTVKNTKSNSTENIQLTNKNNVLGQGKDSSTLNETLQNPIESDEFKNQNSQNILPSLVSKGNYHSINSSLGYTLTPSDSAVINTLGAEKQLFTINPLKDTLIICKQGTKLVFYKSCFEDFKGNVTKTPVNITIKECYNYPDMVKENLNTHCDNDYLESKGMIWVDAQSEGKKLNLREGFDMPIDFAGYVTEDYNLYYSNTNKYSLTNWQLDTLGKIPNPIIIPNSGKYWDITFNYFLDNYKLSKSGMLGLYKKNWDLHFTSENTKMAGFTACINQDIYLNMACQKFRDLCSDIYREVPNIKNSSRETHFGFSCISRDSLNRWLANDTIQKKVNKQIFSYTMNSPYFSSRLGWINCDHPITSSLFKREIKYDELRFTNYPKDGFTQTYLLLKKRKAIANPSGDNSNPVFYSLPKNAEATLFSYKLVNGQIWYLQSDVNTSDGIITLGNYTPMNDVDDLNEKIDALLSTYAN